MPETIARMKTPVLMRFARFFDQPDSRLRGNGATSKAIIHRWHDLC